MIWVVDASVALRWFLARETNPKAERVLEQILETPEMFVVPELFAFEVFSVLHRLHPAADEVYREGVIPILQGGVSRYPMTPDLAEKAADFVKMGLTGYDAAYAALARMNDGLWLTFDQKAHKRIRSTRVSWYLDDGLPDGWPEGIAHDE